MSEILDKIQALPKGSRFYCCALQVNTYEYVKRHNHDTPFADEDSYNVALIDACLEQGIVRWSRIVGQLDGLAKVYSVV